MSHINTNPGGKSTMLLTICLPLPDRQMPQFCAAMLCFPEETPQRLLKQLQNKAVLRSLSDCLEENGEGLERVIQRMEDDGCPGIEIIPMETVGYYDLNVCSAGMA